MSEPTYDTVSADDAKALQSVPTAGEVNRFRRIRNRLIVEGEQQRVKKIAKFRRIAALLRAAGQPLSATLTEALRRAHSPIPCALRGSVKQAGRAQRRLDKITAQAKKVRHDQAAIVKETP